jgi:acetyl-CoA carboxylase biotin carboxyl carrier protein
MAPGEELKDLKELRELIEFLKANGVAEFGMERAELKVRLKFAGAAPVQGAAYAGGGENIPSLGGPPAPAAAITAPQAAAGSGVVPAVAASEVPAAEAGPEAGAHIVKSPIVGTFYDAPSPDAEPFVRMGDRVKNGQVLCIVEAMKLMNEIESDAAGEIVKMYVKPGQPVEYGQALFAIRQ